MIQLLPFLFNVPFTKKKEEGIKIASIFRFDKNFAHYFTVLIMNVCYNELCDIQDEQDRNTQFILFYSFIEL